jgi:hypothetical protein
MAIFAAVLTRNETYGPLDDHFFKALWQFLDDFRRWQRAFFSLLGTAN